MFKRNSCKLSDLIGILQKLQDIKGNNNIAFEFNGSNFTFEPSIDSNLNVILKKNLCSKEPEIKIIFK